MHRVFARADMGEGHAAVFIKDHHAWGEEGGGEAWAYWRAYGCARLLLPLSCDRGFACPARLVVVRPIRIERMTLGLGVPCSILLSYGRTEALPIYSTLIFSLASRLRARLLPFAMRAV